MDSFATLIDQWPSIAAFASDIGVSDMHARAMRRRNSVPPEYWSAAVDGALQHGIPDVSYERLAKLAAAKRRAGESASEAA